MSTSTCGAVYKGSYYYNVGWAPGGKPKCTKVEGHQGSHYDAKRVYSWRQVKPRLVMGQSFDLDGELKLSKRPRRKAPQTSKTR